MPRDRGTTVAGWLHARRWNLADELLLDRDEPRGLQLRQVARKVPSTESGEALQIQEIRALAGRQRRHDRKTRRLMHEPIELGEPLERRAHRDVPAPATARRGVSVWSTSGNTRLSSRWSSSPPIV